MPLSVGQSVLVQYAPDQQWKERVIVLHVKDNDYWAVSPSYDLFPVTLRVPPVHQMRLLPPSRELPSGVEEANCDLVDVATPTGFFTDSELRSFEEEARSLAGVGPAAPSGLDGDSPPAAATRFKGAPPTTGYVWVVGMPPPGSQLRLGDILNVPAALEPDGDPCYLPVHGEDVKVLAYYVLAEERKDFVDMRLQDIRGFRASEDLIGVDAIGDDVRTMPIKRREVTGERFFPFESAVSAMREEEFSDWPIEGPRTTKWLGANILRSAPGPIARHHRWIKDADIPFTDRSRFEHHVLSEVLERAVTYDCLQVSNPASFEIVSRRLQHIEQAHIENPNAADYSGAEFFMGSAERKGGALVAPALALHVASEFRDEASIAKEQRKAREHRGQMSSAPPAAGPNAPAPPKGKGKGKGKKGKPDAGPGAPEKV